MHNGCEQLPIHLVNHSFSNLIFQGSIPFAVIGSNTTTDVRGKQVRVRQYPWGMAEGIFICALRLKEYLHSLFLSMISLTHLLIELPY